MTSTLALWYGGPVPFSDQGKYCSHCHRVHCESGYVQDQMLQILVEKLSVKLSAKAQHRHILGDHNGGKIEGLICRNPPGASISLFYGIVYISHEKAKC